ncbi:MAG: HAD-IA family hydrolase [Gammaproteobacteria bacterium]|nr:HAD-IA family hydrolase [Gammaproteobacteria bacterium]
MELIIFDWDGTLIDSEANIVACLRSMINDLGLPERQHAELSNIIGLGLLEALSALFPGQSDKDYQRMIDRYRYHFFSSESSQPFPGAGLVLSELVNRGYFLAVATGKGRRGLEKGLDNSGFRGFFHATRCADETRSKPHPQMLEEILAELGMDSQQALMVGDTEYDLQMAGHARMAALGVSYGVHETERLYQCQPIAIINEISELLSWLDGVEIAAKGAE